MVPWSKTFVPLTILIRFGRSPKDLLTPLTWRLCHLTTSVLSMEDLYPYCISAYSQPSVLFYGSFILMSNKDHNRATLLVRSFSVTLFNCYTAFTSNGAGSWIRWRFFAGRSPELQVARDVQQIIEVGVRMGLSLNVSKSVMLVLGLGLGP